MTAADLTAAVEAVVERADLLERTIGGLADQFEERNRLEAIARAERIKRDKAATGHIAALSREMKAMRVEHKDSRVEQQKVRADIARVAAMIEAWQTVQAVGRFIKWIGAVCAALVAIWVMVKMGVASVWEGAK